LLPISWIIHREASGDGRSSLILEFETGKFRYHTLAEVQFDLLGGDFAGNIGYGTDRLQASSGSTSRQTTPQNGSRATRSLADFISTTVRQAKPDASSG
jgi:hypothetical protein